jgi:hypothetical protein
MLAWYVTVCSSVCVTVILLCLLSRDFCSSSCLNPPIICCAFDLLSYLPVAIHYQTNDNCSLHFKRKNIEIDN